MKHPLTAALLLLAPCRADEAPGRTFLCCDHNGGQVCVVAADGAITWRMAARNPQDCWKLANGNVVFCNYLGHGHVGTQPQVFEVTRAKRVVRSFAGHERFKTINQVQMLDVAGDVTSGAIVR